MFSGSYNFRISFSFPTFHSFTLQYPLLRLISKFPPFRSVFYISGSIPRSFPNFHNPFPSEIVSLCYKHVSINFQIRIGTILTETNNKSGFDVGKRTFFTRFIVPFLASGGFSTTLKTFFFVSTFIICLKVCGFIPNFNAMSLLFIPGFSSQNLITLYFSWYVRSVCFRYEVMIIMKVYCFKVLPTRWPLLEAGIHVTYWL